MQAQREAPARIQDRRTPAATQVRQADREADRATTAHPAQVLHPAPAQVAGIPQVLPRAAARLVDHHPAAHLLLRTLNPAHGQNKITSTIEHSSVVAVLDFACGGANAGLFYTARDAERRHPEQNAA
jgi:hypothetical protein